MKGSWTRGWAVRVAAVGVSASCLLGGLTLVGAVRERAALPTAAHRFLESTIEASAVTSCLQGARDELYLPGGVRLHTAVATRAALERLRGCDVSGLARSLDAVHLPPPAPLMDARRQAARTAIADGVATLRRVVLDARGADVAMTVDVGRSSADGTAVVLAYRSATAGSDAAYALAEQALVLLGQPQSTVD